MDTEQKTSSVFNFNTVYYPAVFFLFVYGVVNFLGSPLVMPCYFMITLLVLIGIVRFDFNEAIPLVFIHFFIEGQGRVIFGYYPVARVAFDLIIIICLMKHFIRTKRILPAQNMPNLMKVLLLGHFVVFFISLLNVKGAGFWTNFPMVKVYILPFFIFFLFLDTDFDFNSLNFKRLVNTLAILVIMNGILCIKQFHENTPILTSISEYYTTIGKLQNFTKLTFRPFGTSFIPGGMSTYLYLTLGLFFLRPPKGYILAIVTALSISIMVLSQVRTAMIQYLMMYFMFGFTYLKLTKAKRQSPVKITAFALVLGGLCYGLLSIAKMNTNTRLVELTFGRFNTIFESQTFEKSRLGASDISRVILQKLSHNPFGLGPGRTHAITESMAMVIDRDPIYNLDYSWNYDNLWVTIVIEFGFLGIFYAGLILISPVYLAAMTMGVYRSGKLQHLKPMLVSTVTVGLIVLANWGGVGIPYNPVSFMFWFWVAIGFQTYRKSRAEDNLEIPSEFEKSI